MTSSKYIQLTDKVLMEYEYFNEPESTSEEKKEYQIPISGYVYTHTSGFKYIVSDSLTKTRANNIKKRINDFSTDNNFYCLATNNKKYVSRDGGDKDDFATAEEYINNSVEYVGEYFTRKMNCDKVKIYFASSYTEKIDGRFTITISTNYKGVEGNYPFMLANYILDNYENVPTPFLIGERLYTKVVEFYVPSVYDNRSNMFNEELVLPAKIDISFSNIFNETVSSYDNRRIQVLSIVEKSSASVSALDQYATVFASIEEIDDYFKLEGSTKNTWKTFNDFIGDLPGTADDYILMHDITVNELITNTAADEPDWKITTHNVITQTDDFDEPVLFRPVIKYSNCIACVLDYTLRIYCQSNNTQIIKRATYQNFNFAKYGKKLLKINLGTIPPQINVYNKIDENKIDKLTLINNTNNSINVSQEKIFKTSYITSFRDRLNIKASIAPVKIDDITE